MSLVSPSLLRVEAACWQVAGRLWLPATGTRTCLVRSWVSVCSVASPLPSTPLQAAVASPLSRLCSPVRLYHNRPRSSSDDGLLGWGQGQGQGQGFSKLHSTTSASLSSMPADSKLDHGKPTSTITTATMTSTSTMADDRNILPDHFKAAHYDLSLTDLDFTSWTFNGSVTYGRGPSSRRAPS